MEANSKDQKNPDPGYVEHRDGDYYIADSRVLLDGIVYGFLSGQSPEAMAQSYPTLRLEEVYGAIAFYLRYRAAVDEYLKQRESDFDSRRREACERDPMFYRKLQSLLRSETTARS